MSTRINHNTYNEIQNFSLVSSYRHKSFHALNPTKELKKLKKQTELGYNGKTFITSYRYGDNDILIPSVMTIDYYKLKQMAYNHYNQRKESVINNFKESQINAVGQSNKLTLINRDIGFTNVALKLNGQIIQKVKLYLIWFLMNGVFMMIH